VKTPAHRPPPDTYRARLSWPAHASVYFTSLTVLPRLPPRSASVMPALFLALLAVPMLDDE